MEIADVLQFPDTRTSIQEDNRVQDNVARINFLRELPDGTGRWFVNDLRGPLYTVDAATNNAGMYLDFREEFPHFIIGPGGLATGLITVTPHPEFATNGKFYTIHEETAAGNSETPDFIARGNPGNLSGGQHGVVIEWTASDPSSDVFSGTRREIMRIAQPAGNLHNLGDIGFNPLAGPGDEDYGLMYIAGGDGGYDAFNKGSAQAQRLDSIFGKILRIDPSGSNSANGQYGIPTSNPYTNDGNSLTLSEIFASGFRNAHRIMWDTGTGLLFTTDIGQNNIEEINVVHGGANYGWSEREGAFDYLGGTVGPLPANANTDGTTYPVAQYDHGDGDAIAGGFIYRGSAIPQLSGKFVYGDIVRGRLFYSDVEDLAAADDGIATTTAPVYELFLTRNGQPTTLEQLVLGAIGEPNLPADRHDLRFGQTSDGEIYVITKQDGWIRQLVGPNRLQLFVDRESGAVLLQNPTRAAIEVDGYWLASASGSLNPQAQVWNSLSDQGINDWSETSATMNSLAEESTAALTLSINGSTSIGIPYAPAYPAFGEPAPEDVEFAYRIASGEILMGVVEYVGDDVANNLALIVDPVSGEAQLRNNSSFAVAIDGYSILSEAGSLRPADGDWVSFSDQEMSDWIEAAPTEEALSEVKPTSALNIAPGQKFFLGDLFDPGMPRDLELEFHRRDGEQGTTMSGAVVYQLTGDFNEDGVVDIADYVVWRKMYGMLGNRLAADADGDGVVGTTDYSAWRQHYGHVDGSGGAQMGGMSLSTKLPLGPSVPEPATMITFNLAIALIAAASNRARRFLH